MLPSQEIESFLNYEPIYCCFFVDSQQFAGKHEHLGSEKPDKLTLKVANRRMINPPT